MAVPIDGATVSSVVESFVMFRRCISLLLSLSLGCASAYTPKPQAAHHARPHKAARTAHAGSLDVVSYRLPLRDNPIDPGKAARCYGSCQALLKPPAYLDCMAACPGFEVSNGDVCDAGEVPPVTWCLTARKLPPGEKVEPGFVVLGIIAGVALVVSTAAMCASYGSPGGCGGYPPPR
jgi:hypothetical protein